MRTIVWRKRAIEDILVSSFSAVTGGGELLREPAAERRHEGEEA
jgi:hypothetical protein